MEVADGVDGFGGGDDLGHVGEVDGDAGGRAAASLRFYPEDHRVSSESRVSAIPLSISLSWAEPTLVKMT